MRVIAGTYRSRLLNAPAGEVTRPTSDRLRETLFNVLSARVEGAAFADLYAGSGAVGIEALSRGAERVWFVEKEPSAVAAIRANLAALKIQSNVSITPRSVSAALEDFARKGDQSPWDIIFLDPPYQSVAAYESTLQTVGNRPGIFLAPDGVVIAEHQLEHRAESGVAERYGQLLRFRILKQGDAVLSFYHVAA
jgi:16S rRNA (guanine(966)-N(2))-methyltransferase RsmD